jgi:DNA-directed RNA polymerase subunit RPC12/RpoP
MPRFLKTKGTCLNCGGEAPIRSLKEAEHVRCEHCRELVRLLSMARHRDARASKEWKEAPSKPGPLEVALYLRAAASRLEAAAYVLEAYAHGMKGIIPVDERRWLSWAKGRAESAASLATHSIPLVTRERDAAAHGLVALPGAPTGAELSPAPTAHGVLRLVGLGEEGSE